MFISIITAMDENQGIGWKNKLPWHLPKEYALFKKYTKQHIIIMGSRTFESLGSPLPQRTHIVISRNIHYNLPSECILANSLEQAIDLAQKNSPKEVFIIGGAQIYSSALPIANFLYISHIHAKFTVDAYFPTIDWKQWHIIKEEFYPKDEKNAFSFTFRLYEKVKNSS